MQPNNELALEDVISRLKQNQRVAGILQIGSLTTDTFSSDSDYDIVVVLYDAPRDRYVGVTAIAGRFSDLLFVDFRAIEKLVNSSQTTILANDPLEPIVRWLQQGRIIFSRTTLLGRAQTQFQKRHISPPTHDDARGSWFAINYNIAQTRRMLRSTNPLYRQTAEVRMAIYGHSDVWHGYFTINQRQWKGEKEAISYLQLHDPTFLYLYQQFIKETDPDRKFRYYVFAAAVATKLQGGLWPENVTILQDQTAPSWQDLIDAPDIPFLWRVQIWQVNASPDGFPAEYPDDFVYDNNLLIDEVAGHQSIMSWIVNLDKGGLSARSVTGFGELFLEINSTHAFLSYNSQPGEATLVPRFVNQPTPSRINCRQCVEDEDFLATSGIYRLEGLALLQTFLRTGKLPTVVEHLTLQPVLPGLEEATAINPERLIVEWVEE